MVIMNMRRLFVLECHRVSVSIDGSLLLVSVKRLMGRPENIQVDIICFNPDLIHVKTSEKFLICNIRLEKNIPENFQKLPIYHKIKVKETCFR